MKHSSIKLFSPLLLVLAVIVSLSLGSCKEAPTANSPSIAPPLSAGSVTWNAHPVICYAADTNVGTSRNPSLRGGLWVMDSTGLNWRCIYYNPSPGTLPYPRPVSWPSWNPTGTSILWSESDGTNGYLKKIDVSVVNGIPVGSNVTTVYTVHPTDSFSIRTATWCSNSSNNVAALGLNDLHNPNNVNLRRSHIRLVNMSTSAASDIFVSDSDFWAYTPSFNPDGTKIALIQYQFHGNYHGLQIIDLTGNILKSIALDSATAPAQLDWSRTSGRIAYGGGSANSTGWVNMIDTASGSTHSAICTGLVGPSWNPTDWKIVTWVGGGVLGTSYIKTVQVATGTIATIRSPGMMPNWKR